MMTVKLDGMSLNPSYDRRAMMLLNKRRDSDIQWEPDTSDILASLHSPSHNSPTDEIIKEILEATSKVDKEEDRTQRSGLKNSTIEKSTLEAFGKTDSLFLLSPPYRHMNTMIPWRHRQKNP